MTDPYYAQAKRQVRKKKGFYRHLTSYIIINAFILAINLITDPFDQWFVFPLLSWGVGLAFHYINVFGLPGNKALSKEWEEKEIEKEMQRLQREDNLKHRYKSLPEPDHITMPDEELELNDFKKLRKEWDDSELV
ncbi:MAG: 2TM domain-containing protein [Saprospiraceae bacterium]